MRKRLYYHKTDGGAEYLTDRWKRNPDGSKEGVFKGSSFIVRIDGNLRRDAVLTVADRVLARDLAEALRESVLLQSHYARLLNAYDGGSRRSFATPEAWVERLREIGTIPGSGKLKKSKTRSL